MTYREISAYDRINLYMFLNVLLYLGLGVAGPPHGPGRPALVGESLSLIAPLTPQKPSTPHQILLRPAQSERYVSLLVWIYHDCCE